MKLTVTKKRVRSVEHGIPYSIDEWSRGDFANFYERRENTKYNHGTEEYKKKCIELENIIIELTKKHSEIVRSREEELTKKFNLMLSDEIVKAVRAKEIELVGRFSKLIQKKDNLKDFKDLMENEIANRVNEQLDSIKHDLENRYNVTIQNQRNQVTKMSLGLGNKPKKTGTVFVSRFQSECYYCKGQIYEGAPICQAEFSNGRRKYVHQDCCDWYPNEEPC